MGYYNLYKIEQIQHEAARIITGLPKCSSLESLYFETGWEPLHSHRRRRKLNMFYKIRNNNAPSYLCDAPSFCSKSNRQSHKYEGALLFRIL
jgi:hypothetical protein